MRASSSTTRVRVGSAVLLLVLAACTAVDNSSQAPGMVPVGQPPKGEPLPINPVLGHPYMVLNDAEHDDNGNHYGHNKPHGPHVDQDTIVTAEEPYTEPDATGSPPPTELLVQEVLPEIAQAYGPIDSESVQFTVLPMQDLKAADDNARTITFISGTAQVLVMDLTGEFQANAVPPGVSPDTYRYMRVYRDAVTGKAISTLLSKTPIESSVTPTPTPPPTPTPTPVPTPSYSPPDPGALVALFHGLHADAAGNVYLFGLDPATVPGVSWSRPFGRMIKVTPGGTMTELLAARQGPAVYEGDIDANGKLQAFSDAFRWIPEAKQNHRVTFDLSTGAYTFSNFTLQRNSEFIPPFGASCLDDANKLVIAPGYWANSLYPAFDVIREPGATFVNGDPNLLAAHGGTGSLASAVDRPVSMVWDSDDDRPIWSCATGIVVTNGQVPPNNYFPVLGQPVYGLAKVDDNATGVLYTRYNGANHSVYYAFLDADKDNNPTTNPVVQETAFTFAANSIPLRIEKRAKASPTDNDNTFYVLLTEAPQSGALHTYSWPGKKQVRVVRMTYDPATHKLTNPMLMVDSFSNKISSW